jgi:hypothetical protein
MKKEKKKKGNFPQNMANFDWFAKYGIICEFSLKNISFKIIFKGLNMPCTKS